MKKNTIAFSYEDDDGEEVEVELPACWEICDRCRGNGTHVNPSIDGHGITMEEWNGPDWDDESREMYMSGGYDVRCEAGCVDGKVLEIDMAQLDDDTRKRVEVRQQQQAEWDAEQVYWRRLESGGRDW